MKERSNATGFGDWLREYRLEQDERLYDMAASVGVSPSFLSAVETGRKPAPASLVEALVDHMELGAKKAERFRVLAMVTGPEFRLSLNDNNEREVTEMFARQFESNLEKLRDALAALDSGGTRSGRKKKRA